MLKNDMVEYTLTRAKRKSIAITVKDGLIKVRAPFRSPLREINDFVSEKEKWITDKLAEEKEEAAKRKSFSLNYGSQILYRGDLYTIKESACRSGYFDDTSFYVPPNLTPAQIKRRCADYYKDRAAVYFEERVCVYIEQMAVLPKGLKISSAKRRWGSCSAKSVLTFSWMLLMADDDIIDYLIVHELAHLIEFNHSPRFWAVVEEYFPNYKVCEKRKKALERKLICEDWGY